MQQIVAWLFTARFILYTSIVFNRSQKIIVHGDVHPQSSLKKSSDLHTLMISKLLVY